MKLGHEIRGHLHALRLHLTFLERALTKSTNADMIESSMLAMVELHAVEEGVVQLIARHVPVQADR